MIKRVLKWCLKFLIVCLLTIFTQIGGFIYLIAEITFRKNVCQYRLKKFIVFVILYLGITFSIIPLIAPIFGREKLKDSSYIKAHTFFTKLLNRNYIKAELHISLQEIAASYQKQHPGVKIVYLDANFPFINGFPLYPHLSHNDGKKIDISFVYRDQNDRLTNRKPSLSGYGVFEKPIHKEYDQTKACKKNGYWQYDYAQYLTFGTINKNLKFSEKATKDLLLAIVNHQQIGKVFIEPHLKNRLGVENSKIRFHGCQAVRHDDHIHLQLK